jgi:signal transduction histidine kinase/AmiR/NasT family two-component response regulator
MQSLTKITARYPKFATLIETFAKVQHEVLFFVGEGEELLGVNEQALNALGYTSFEKLETACSKKISSLFLKSKGFFTPQNENWMTPLGEGRPLILLADRDKRAVPYRLKVQRVDIEDTFFYILLLQNVEAIEKARKAQNYFETFKQQFLTNMSHEFRTPMNSIIGFSGLLENSGINVLQAEYVYNIQNSAMAMLENVENLLELMQVESGAIKLNQQAFKPYEVFETFAAAFYPSAREKKIGLFFMIDPRLPGVIIGDEDKIKRILKNLISNALKFTSEGGQVLVEILVKELDGKSVVRYSVTDTGEGIAKDRLQTLLRPFASARENKLKGKDGFGVGLTLSFKLLKMMKTQLSVASEVGRGSRFSFTLKHSKLAPVPFEVMSGSQMAVFADDPDLIVHAKILKKYLKSFSVKAMHVKAIGSEELREMDALFIIGANASKERFESIHNMYPSLQIVAVAPPEKEDDFLHLSTQIEGLILFPILPSRVYETLNVVWKKVPKGLLKKKEEKEQEAHVGHKILVAEDNPINQKLIITILEQAGYQVTAADNGQIAVDLYMIDKYDLVLMDIDMPVMDGITANRLIKEIDDKDNRPFTPVVALTARAMAGDRERIIGAGLDAHLSKPVDREFLLQTIDRFLKMKEQRNLVK